MNGVRTKANTLMFFNLTVQTILDQNNPNDVHILFKGIDTTPSSLLN